jgi:hypothetical protein
MPKEVGHDGEGGGGSEMGGSPVRVDGLETEYDAAVYCLTTMVVILWKENNVILSWIG